MAQMIRHAGSRLVTPRELESIPTPAPDGPRHAPIAHTDVRGALVGCLGAAGFNVDKETLAVAGPGDEDFFGLLELSVRPRDEEEPEGAALLRRLMGGPVKSLQQKDAGWEVHESEDFSPAVAFRHSNRKRFGFRALYGAQVTVCDNTCLWGGEPLAKFKHTPGVNLYAAMADCVRRVTGKLKLNRAYVERLKAMALAEAEAKARMFEIFRTGAVPTKYLKPVAVNFFEPDDDMSDCHGHNAWALYNSFTRVLRDEPLHTRLAHTTALLRHFPVLADMAETVNVESTNEAQA